MNRLLRISPILGVGLLLVGGSGCGSDHRSSVIPGIEFVRLEPGTFVLGKKETPKSRAYRETQHQVTLSRDYWIGVTEVTQAQWDAQMEDNPSSFRGPDLPVENVSFVAAAEFANRLSVAEGFAPVYVDIDDLSGPRWIESADGFRLPTEAEWEYAARAGTDTQFHFGDQITLDLANYGGSHLYSTYQDLKDPYLQTLPVGSFPPNEWGLYDVHGNVGEWVWDRLEAYSEGAVVDPERVTTQLPRVIRGGGWHDNGRFCRSADRRHVFRELPSIARSLEPGSKLGGDVGLRLARTVNTRETKDSVSDAGSGLRFVYIRATTFFMGSPESEQGRYVAEPLHEVTLTRPFLVSRTEITQAQWHDVMGTSPSFFPGCDDCPVEQVSWYDAVRFCNRLSEREGRNAVYDIDVDDGDVSWRRGANGYRLPTDAEWHFASYPSGEDTLAVFRRGWIDSVGWIAPNSDQRTHSVGLKPANNHGIYDTQGNVWEWCWDRYGEYPDGAVTDPLGSPFGVARVKRGGSWGSGTDIWGPWPRGGFNPRSDTNKYMGFRVAMDAD